MAAQEYEITEFRKGDFQDNYGNTWCDMVLLGVGEPVRIVVKNPLDEQYTVGNKLYGEIKEVTSKAGKAYKRFYREERPEQTQGFHGSNSGKSYDSDGQAWGNAITNATNLVVNTLEPGKDLNDATELVLATAEVLFNGRNGRKTQTELMPVGANDEPLPEFEG